MLVVANVFSAVPCTGEVKDPMYLLGTLHSSIPSPNHFLTRPSGDFPVLRGKGAAGVNTRGAPKFRFLPVELADYPVEVRLSWPQQVLAMQLSNVRTPVFWYSLALEEICRCENLHRR